MIRGVGVSVVLLALLAAACSDEDEPTPLPPITATPTPSVTVVATPSVSAFPETPQGAAAFARFVFEQSALAYKEKNPERVRHLFDAACTSCTRTLATLMRLQSGEVTLTGGDSRLLSAESPAVAGQDAIVFLREKADLLTFVNKEGRVTASEPAGEYQSKMTLRRAGSSWVVLEREYFKS